MNKEIKTKMVDGEKYYLCEDENKYFPQYVEENGLWYELDISNFTYLPMLVLDDEEGYDFGEF